MGRETALAYLEFGSVRCVLMPSIRSYMTHVPTQYLFFAHYTPDEIPQPHSSLHWFPNTLARITFTRTNYSPHFKLRRRASRCLGPRWRGGSHSVKWTGMARATGGLAIRLTGDGHGRKYARLKWKGGSRSLLKFMLRLCHALDGE